jgi:hypothetical protein
MTLLALVLAGCGTSRWSPTDPRLDKPDPAQAVVVDSWSIQVGTTVTAMALPHFAKGK